MDQIMIESQSITKPVPDKTFDELFPGFAERAANYDRENSFVKENYDELKREGFFSATIPVELGGSGLSHGEMCDLLRRIAHSCSSTALACSMHHHLVAANIWKYKKGQGGEVLKKVAATQAILISTGAMDWLSSNGEMKKTENGYLVNAIKHFASQSVMGDILVTSAAYNDPGDGWQVLHFPVPMKTAGVSVLDNWDAMGMKGTGSNSVLLQNVFVPENTIVLRRQRGVYHPFFNVVITAALPLIMAVYVGIAEKAAEIAISEAKNKKDIHSPYLAGEMMNELTIARVVWKDSIRIANNLEFEAAHENGNEGAMRKTIVTEACIKTVEKAMELAGGRAYLRKTELEQLFRDVQAARYHPLQTKVQHQMTGSYVMTGEI